MATTKRKRNAVRQTACRYCDLDIENFSPYKKCEWRDRGGNTHCPDSRKCHAPTFSTGKRFVNPRTSANPLARAIPAKLIADGKGGYRVFVNAKLAGLPVRNGKVEDAGRARAIFQRAGIDPHDSFFTLSHSQVSRLLEEADAVRYRKPKNANGSRGRYFHAYLKRKLDQT